MRVASPLRYPGGKAVLSEDLARIRSLNDLTGTAVAEPFAGGAGASLSLLFQRKTPQIHINDLDPAIFAFWQSVVQRSAELLGRLEDVPISVEEWDHWRNVYRSGESSPFDRGFAAFYLNRCNRSGIIDDGGVIGGREQSGRWKIDARFNKRTLRTRLERIGAERERISVTGEDGVALLQRLDPDSTFFFIDPPYLNKGRTLYMNGLDPAYHARLAAELKNMDHKAWALTYDDCLEIRELYEGWAAVRPFSLRYTARERRMGRELLITPKWLEVPERLLVERGSRR